MYRSELAHWWYRTLHLTVFRTIRSRFNNRPIRVIDAGCGTGGMMDYLRHSRLRAFLSGFDLSTKAVAYARSRGLNAFVGDLQKAADFAEPASADVVLSLDNLYFFDQPGRRAVLTAFARMISADGIIIINTPAFGFFAGTHDLAVGVTRRFTHSRLCREAARCGLRVCHHHYWPLLVSPLVLGVRLIEQLRMRLSKAVEIQSDLHYTNGIANQLLSALGRIELLLPPSLRRFGSSVFLVLTHAPAAAAGGTPNAPLFRRAS